MSAADTPPAFEIKQVALGLRNTGHFGERTIAEGMVNVGPFRFVAYLLNDGAVSLPADLRDERLRLEISAQLRVLVAQEAATRWAAISEYERRRFDERQAERDARRKQREGAN